MVIRFFDIVFSCIALVLLFPLFIVLAIFIVYDSRGGIFYLQQRVGKNNRDFRMVKFRSMTTGSDQRGGLTIGAHDRRITRAGAVLRKYKFDELPQLLNVIKGDMSLVGPRPEIRKYVDLYTDDQRRVLSVRPGLTDYASIEYINENELLGNSPDPEKTYIEEIMPAKIGLNMRFILHPTLGNYFSILYKTIKKIWPGKH